MYLRIQYMLETEKWSLVVKHAQCFEAELWKDGKAYCNDPRYPLTGFGSSLESALEDLETGLPWGECDG